LLDLVPVPLGYNVERAEGYDAEVGCEVVDVAALQALLVLVIRWMRGRLDTALETDNRDAYEPTFPAPHHHSLLWLD